MHSKQQSQNFLFISRAVPATLTTILVLTLMIFSTPSAQAQTFQVIHSFTGGPDGGEPASHLITDTAGNLYGTTLYGGAGVGVVFKRSKQGSAWVLAGSYEFQGAGEPLAAVIFGPDGSLYGTTSGLGGNGCGTVYRLRPPAQTSPNSMSDWSATVLYSFLGGSDGCTPYSGNLTFDQSGNIYGTTYGGGQYNAGTVYSLTPSNGGWTESLLYTFMGGSDGLNPESGVIFDPAGNLYGTTSGGGLYYSYGTVFQLTPSVNGWTKKTLYRFRSGNDGANPVGGLFLDQSGNVYGTTINGGHDNFGSTFFKLTPSGRLDGSIAFTPSPDWQGLPTPWSRIPLAICMAPPTLTALTAGVPCLSSRCRTALGRIPRCMTLPAATTVGDPMAA